MLCPSGDSTIGRLDDEESDPVPLTTGSVAEFYIEPMLPNVGDIDVMYHLSTQLAIPRGHPPPTQLPAEFHNYVKVLEIIDSDFAGYVYLELRYLLTECDDDGKYSAAEYDRGWYLANKIDIDIIHGPAVRIAGNEKMLRFGLPVDDVRCTRCLLWPLQAADWPLQHRNYDWPDSATAEHAVSYTHLTLPTKRIV